MKKGGQGGNRASATGLEFEKQTSVADALSQAGYSIIKDQILHDNNLVGRLIGKNSLYVFLEERELNWREIVTSRLLPDEAVFSVAANSVTVVEKKWQETSGSVDEKLQTCGFKMRQYKRLLDPIGVEVKFVYLLNDWFTHPRYGDVLEYIRETGAEYHFKSLPLSLFELGE